MRGHSSELANAQVFFFREIVLRKSLLDRRSVVRSGRHRGWRIIHSLRPEDSLLRNENRGNPRLRVIQMDAYHRRRLRIRGWDQHPHFVMDPASAVPSNLSNGVVTDDRTVTKNVR